MQGELRIIPVRGIGDVRPGDDLAALILAALPHADIQLENGDILVVTQKIVSKAEGRIANPDDVEPSAFARTIAIQGRKDAHYQEVVLRESRRIVKMDKGVLITETHHGLICANAGVDESNVGGGRLVTLLPTDPDHSAAQLRTALCAQTSVEVAVIISDTFGRPWREGQVNIAIGVAGIDPLTDYAGVDDPYGYRMQASMIAIGDELASAAELVMGKIDNVPVAIVRGFAYTPAESSAQRLIRNPAMDLFR
jgi:coenzyme F420-0:L-glutamate ligase/coenzyme F420-1:gamma-L-glutamate ligase